MKSDSLGEIKINPKPHSVRSIRSMTLKNTAENLFLAQSAKGTNGMNGTKNGQKSRLQKPLENPPTHNINHGPWVFNGSSVAHPAQIPLPVQARYRGEFRLFVRSRQSCAASLLLRLINQIVSIIGLASTYIRFMHEMRIEGASQND